jgi:ribonuclease-3 family protein
LKPDRSAEYSTQTLAYLGDAVFELCVREMVITGDAPAGKLNKKAKTYVSAKAQAKMYHALAGSLTEGELSALRRGRNLNSASRSKNADMSEYRLATGIEALFGYLYINGSYDRIKEVFELCAKTVTESPTAVI